MSEKEIELPCLHGWKMDETEALFVPPKSAGGILTPSQYWNEEVNRVSTTKEHIIPYRGDTIATIFGGEYRQASHLVWRPIQHRSEVTIADGFGCFTDRVAFSSMISEENEVEVEALLSYGKLRIQHPGYRLMVWTNGGMAPSAKKGRWRRAKPLEVISSLLALFLSGKGSNGRYCLGNCYVMSCAAQGGRVSLEYATILSRMQSLRLWVLQPDEGFLDLG